MKTNFEKINQKEEIVDINSQDNTKEVVYEDPSAEEDVDEYDDPSAEEDIDEYDDTLEIIMPIDYDALFAA